MRLSFIDCGMVSCSVSLWAVLGRFAVIFPLLGGFNCQPFMLVGSLTADLSCWLVLIHCNLLSLSLGVLAAILLVHEYFSAEIFISSRVSVTILSRSRVLFCQLQPGLSLLCSLRSQCLPSCCSRIVYMLYQKIVHVKLE